jgi:hypothetical protein
MALCPCSTVTQNILILDLQSCVSINKTHYLDKRKIKIGTRLHYWWKNKTLAQPKHKLIDFLKGWYNCLDWQTNILEIILVDNDLIFIWRFHGNIPLGRTRRQWEDKIILLLQKRLVNRTAKPQDKVQGDTSLLKCFEHQSPNQMKYGGYSESNLQWAVNKSSNKKNPITYKYT